jgi:hypothetical protein
VKKAWRGLDVAARGGGEEKSKVIDGMQEISKPGRMEHGVTCCDACFRHVSGAGKKDASRRKRSWRRGGGEWEGGA